MKQTYRTIYFHQLALRWRKRKADARAQQSQGRAVRVLAKRVRKNCAQRAKRRLHAMTQKVEK